jgi:hypothetical protein
MTLLSSKIYNSSDDKSDNSDCHAQMARYDDMCKLAEKTNARKRLIELTRREPLCH